MTVLLVTTVSWGLSLLHPPKNQVKVVLSVQQAIIVHYKPMLLYHVLQVHIELIN
jgi:hypothetical protein